ncbi:PREDICTED: putative WBSCR19-like protein 6 isoform X2 [Chinchilla lanigera]|uniref:putative WBSCR19-like protein 6 isoform X2 n=1 Tax=Chinchilla lanigera TaxID=34839 RepID=UPI00038E9B56|nr:PREDICTED: putative WBSCR19-like protein 6 isoform X2 [Chinchilla lanigera]
MATGEPSFQFEDQSPQPICPEYALEVVVDDDEIPGQSGLWEASSLAPQACVQKRKTDWFAEPEEELHEHLLVFVDGVPRLASYLLSQSPPPKKQKGYISESELVAEQEKDHQGGPDSVLSGNTNLPAQFSGHNWKRKGSSISKEDEEGVGPWDTHIAARENMRLPPRKRWRQYLSLLCEESQETWGCFSLCPVPSTHTGVVEKPCGLKKKRKRKHLSSVLPEHHAAFTRLLEDPIIRKFLAWDMNLRTSDKYLLAMVIAYFSRAGLFPWQYQRIHFFLALHLANDMEEEDNELAKLDMFFFMYGWNLAQIPKFHKLRYEFICCMGWDLRVTREECEEIQAYDPGLWVWRRDRTLIQGTLEP